MTKREKARIEAFRHIGCIATGSPQYDVHHLTAGYRMGHWYTIPLHPWLHRAYSGDLRPSECEERFGPSLARNKHEFVAKYGTEMSLWEKTNELLARFL